MTLVEVSSLRAGSDPVVVSAREMPVDGKMAPCEAREIPIGSLRPGESPRLNGEDHSHIAWLAETQAALPPILVDRRTMRVIDGMHRLLAASIKGRPTIDVEFFDGSPADAFLRAVEANVTHGLPLSRADRRAAAARIVQSHPDMSDRAIGEVAGLAAKTVASIRRRSTGVLQQSDARVGRDGRVRPLDNGAGRLRAAKVLAEHPRASLREVARAAGVSPTTVGDVRKRLQRGQQPVPGPQRQNGTDGHAPVASRSSGGRVRIGCGTVPATALEKLARDPSLRHNEQGRRLLFLLRTNLLAPKERPRLIAAVPPHCAVLVAEMAHQYAQMWLDFARALDERARVIDPWNNRRHLNGAI